MRLAIILIVIFSVFKAQAALITIGSFSIDETRFADSVVLVSGTSVKPPSNAEGFNFDTYVSVDTSSQIKASFDNLQLLNGSGFDILVFELAALEVMQMSLSIGGLSVSGSLIERVIGDPSLSRTVNIYGFDLSDFGISSGGSLISDLFLGSLADTPDIAAIAVLNGSDIGSGNGSISVSAPPTLMLLSLMLIFISTRKWKNS